MSVVEATSTEIVTPTELFGKKKSSSKKRYNVKAHSKHRRHVRTEPEHLKVELERQKSHTEALRNEAEKRLDDAAVFHEKQLRDLHEQNDKDLRLLKHQHEQHLRTLRQSYEVQIQKLKEEQEARVTNLKQDTNEKNQRMIEKTIEEQEKEMELKIKELKNEMGQKLQDMTEAYNKKLEELKQKETELKMSEEQRSKVEKENTQCQKAESELHQKNTEVSDELSNTKARLKVMKQEYQANLRDLQNALSVSKEHLQHNYELISGLKADKSRLVMEIEELKKQLSDHEANLRFCVLEKKDLQEKLKTAEIDAHEYDRKMKEVIAKEKLHHQGIEYAAKTLDDHHNQIQQCKIAIKESQMAMEQEKLKHIALRKEYQDHSDRLASLNDALEKCRSKNADTDKILHDMNLQYNQLKAKSERMIAELEKLAAEKNSYQEGLEAERNKLRQVEHDLALSRKAMEEELKRTEKNEHYTHKLLETCQQKGDACLHNNKTQSEYIAKLEAEIKHAMRVLKDEETLKKKIGKMDEVVALKDKEMHDLKSQLAKLQVENKQMKSTIETFNSHHDADNEMMSRHAQLKAHHEKSMKWIEDMKRQHELLREQHHTTGKHLEKTTHDLNKSEENMQHHARVIRDMEKQVSELKDRIGKCLYPGEKERLESQLRDLIRERETLRTQMNEATNKHGEMYQKMQKLMKENEDLKVLATRYEMDAKQMQKVVEQGAQLNIELVNSRKLLSKKDEQLELLSTQLAALIHRVKILEEREVVLQQKLKYSSSPEEVENLTTHLNACRMEMKKNVAKYEAIQQIATKMKEQNVMNQNKVRTLVEVLKDTENANTQLQNDRMQRDQLHAALKECATERKITTQELEARIQAIEKQYSANLITHEKMMAESNSRIADLQQQLLRSAEIEKNTRMRRMQGMDMPADPMRKDELIAAVENNSERYIHELKQQLAILQAEQKETGNSTEAAVKAANLKAAEQLQKVRLMHQQAMREKERQIMSTREKTYDNLLAALDVANRNPDVNPNDVYGQIREIRTQGAAREQQAMADMLKLRAINAKLANEYKLSRQVQAELLQKANVGQRNKILETAQANGGDSLRAHTQAYNALINAQRNHLLAQQQDVSYQLKDQQQYIQELQNQLPKMKAIEQKINLERFPDLNVLQTQIGQEKRFTVGALGYENKEAIGQSRSLSAAESQLMALDASVRGMTDQVKRYISQPSKDNLVNLQNMAQMSPGQIQTVLQNQQQLQDRSTVRTTLLVQPRPPELGPPGKGMAIDMSTGEVQLKPAGSSPTEPPKRYFGSQVMVFEEPKKTFAPVIARTEAQLTSGHDLIAITYSFDLDRPGRGNSLKYIVFSHALEQLFPRIQAMSKNGSIDIQLVRILPYEERRDLLSMNNILQKACTYSTCTTTKKTVNSVNSVSDILQDLTQRLNEKTNTEDHIVMTLSAPGSKGRIHIADVLFKPENDSGNIPTAESIRLLDSSVLTYLSDVIQDPDIKIDLFFNILPFADNDVQTSTANDRLLQVSERIQNFLSQLHPNQ
jgi:chromosome segregation ATPase